PPHSPSAPTPRSSDLAQTDLGHTQHIRHLGRAAHDTRQAVPHSVYLVTPVVMCVNLDDVERLGVSECVEDRNRDFMAAADRKRRSEEHTSELQSRFAI